MKVAVIGAGAGGLAVANMLAYMGYEVTVHEKNKDLGGRMGQMQHKGFTFDTGPSWYLMPEVFEHYFSLLRHKPSDYYKLERLTPAYKVFFDYAKPITVKGDIVQDAATFEQREAGAGAMLHDYVAESKMIYQLALDYFLYNPFDRFAPLLKERAVMAQSGKLLQGLTVPLHRHVARKVASQELQQILEYAMVFLGTSPFEAPSLYRLMSYLDFEQGVFFPQGGMHKVTEALVALGAKLGVTYRPGTPVEGIEVKNSKAVGVRVNGAVMPADIVVSGADLAFTETQLLPRQYQTYPSLYWERKKAAPAALLLYLGVRGTLPELQHHNLFFVKDWQKNFGDIYATKQWPQKASMYVSKTSASDASVAPKGHENIFVLVPLPAGKNLDAQTQQKLVDRYLSQLVQLSGIADLRERIVSMTVRGPADFVNDFHAWQGSALGMSHTLRQSAFMRPKVKSKKVSNLYYVGGMTQPGIGVPMCLISAELVVKALTGDTSPGPLDTLPKAAS